MSVRDTRMLTRALEQRWPIKPEYREAIIKRLLRVIADPQSSPREVASASKALLAAEKQNQEDEHKLIDVSIQHEHNRLDAIASELGIEQDFIEAVARKAGANFSGDPTCETKPTD